MEARRFGELFALARNGLSIKQDKSSGGLPITRIETISNAVVDPERVGYAGLQNGRYDAWLLRPGDILFSHINSLEHLGKCALYMGVPEKLIHGMNLLCLRCDPTVADPRFVTHLIRSPEFRSKLARIVNPSVNQVSVSITNLRGLEVSLPTLPEQRRIAAILDKADELRRKRQEAIAKLDTLLLSVFLEMFGDPLSNVREWPKASLKECTTHVVDCPHSTPRWTLGGKVCIRTSNLLKGEWDWSDRRFISEEEFRSRTSRSTVIPGDVILSREGTVGIAAIVDDGMEICLGQRLVQVRPDRTQLTSEYLLAVLLYSLDPERIGRVMVGSTSKHLNVAELRSMPIPVPPMGLQCSFSEAVTQIKRIKNQGYRALADAENLFCSLQSEFLTPPVVSRDVPSLALSS